MSTMSAEELAKQHEARLAGRTLKKKTKKQKIADMRANLYLAGQLDPSCRHAMHLLNFHVTHLLKRAFDPRHAQRVL